MIKDEMDIKGQSKVVFPNTIDSKDNIDPFKSLIEPVCFFWMGLQS